MTPQLETVLPGTPARFFARPTWSTLESKSGWGGGVCHIYIVCTVRNIIMTQFIYVKILDWNVNKSASRFYVYAPKVE